MRPAVLQRGGGLVTSQVHRGCVVSPLSAEEAEEVFAIRLKLEPDATVRGSLLAEPHVRNGSLDQGRHNRLFHMALVGPGAGRVIVSMLDRLNVLADRYVRLHLGTGRQHRANAEHRKLLKLWIDKDEAELHALAERHIASTLDDLRRQLV